MMAVLASPSGSNRSPRRAQSGPGQTAQKVEHVLGGVDRRVRHVAVDQRTASAFGVGVDRARPERAHPRLADTGAADDQHLDPAVTGDVVLDGQPLTRTASAPSRALLRSGRDLPARTTTDALSGYLTGAC